MATRYECDRCRAQSENDWFVRQAMIRTHSNHTIRADLCKECVEAVLGFIHPVPEGATLTEEIPMSGRGRK